MKSFEICSTDADPTRYLAGVLALGQEEQRGRSMMIAHGAEFYARYQGEQGESTVALVDDRVVGYSLLATPARLHAIWLPRAEHLNLDRRRCGCLVQVVVAPDVRGQGISSALVEATLDAARHLGIEHLFTSVAPENAASVRMVERGGFRQFEVAKVYSEQVLRALFHLDLENPTPVVQPSI